MNKQKDQWDSSGYLKRKAERQEKVAPRWVTNPETEERFLVRDLGSTAIFVASSMPVDTLKAEAITAWQEAGVELPKNGDGDDDEPHEATDIANPEVRSAAKRNASLMGRTVMQACVVPRIVLSDAKSGEIELADLDNSDLQFIYRVALGIAADSEVELQGGGSATVEEIKSVPGKSRKRSGTIGRG